MNYRETLPSLRLATYVKCFWALEFGRTAAGDEPEPVVPDGCVEIVFNLSDRFRRYHDGGHTETQPATIVAGQMDRNVLIGPSGDVRLFGIRFKPFGAFPFFRFDMSELLNRIEPLDAAWGSSVALIEDELASAPDFGRQVIVAEAALSRQVARHREVDPSLLYAVGAISSGSGVKRISQLARELGVSERGLERRFSRFVGLGPKTFSRIVRFQNVLRYLGSEPTPDVLDAAAAFGYFDQSHLINDFRQFAGCGPTAFGERPAGLTGLFVASE